MVAVAPITIATRSPKKPNAMIPSTTPTPTIASSSTTSATAIYYNGLFDVPNPDNKLRISMTAMVSIVRGQAQGALTVPVGALSARQADGRYQVKVLDAEGRVVPRPIRVGINNNVMVQVLEGLNEGDRVVLGQALANADAPKAGPGGGMRPPPGL